MSSSFQPLAGKTALITGASKGIGAATSLHLASLGANVVVNYSSDSKPAEALVQQIGSDKAIAIKADASNVKEIERLVKETLDKFGSIDILIPNAGVAMNHSLEETTEENWERTMAVNVKGPYFLVQKAVPHMKEGSHIILLSTSLCALSNITPNYLLYVHSKGAIEQMVRVLAKDLGRKGIAVNAVAPGPTGTDLFYQGKSEQLVKTIAGFNPFNKIGEPEQIARAIAFLSGGDGKGGVWVNGQIMRVNGGMTVGAN